MKICQNCGEENDLNSDVCKKCGKKLDEESENLKKNNSNSTLSIVLKNLKFYLTSLKSLIFSFISVVICVLAIVFFNFRRHEYLSRIDQTLAQSSLIMIIIFSFFLLLGTLCFVASLIFNIKNLKNKNGQFKN